MSNQHHPPESGRRPFLDILESAPTCYLCSWVWQKLGECKLKYVHSGCGLHRLTPDGGGTAAQHMARADGLTGDEPEKCRGCDTEHQVSWSPLFGWLCPSCRWSRTERYFMVHRVTVLPDRAEPDPGAA